MKTKAFLSNLIIITIVAFNATGQIKIFDDNWIQLGSLSKGGFGVSIEPNGYTYFNPSCYGEYAFMNLTYSRDDHSKCYIVDRNGEHTFFVYGNGHIYSRGEWLGSDTLFKENITDLDDALSKICKLRGVYFKFKKDKKHQDSISYRDKTGKIFWIKPKENDSIDPKYINPKVKDSLLTERNRRNIGIIAQEVEKVVPELVRTMPDGSKAVAYYSVIGLLIESVKEQQKEIINISRMLEECCSSYGPDNSANNSTQTGTNIKNELIPDKIASILYQNIPNPFSESTTIRYKLSNFGNDASILLFDMQGSLLKSFNKLDADKNEIIIHGKELKPGMYLYTLIVNGKEIDTKRMILTE